MLGCSFAKYAFAVVEGGFLWLTEVGDIYREPIKGLEYMLQGKGEHLGSITWYRKGVRPYEVVVCAEELYCLGVYSAI